MMNGRAPVLDSRAEVPGVVAVVVGVAVIAAVGDVGASIAVNHAGVRTAASVAPQKVHVGIAGGIGWRIDGVVVLSYGRDAILVTVGEVADHGVHAVGVLHDEHVVALVDGP